MALDPIFMREPCRAAQALLVVSAEGRVRFASARATVWLRDFSSPRSGSLPLALRDWLQDALTSARSSPFLIERPGVELSIQILLREPDSICLLLEKKAEKRVRQGKRPALTRRQTEVLSWVARGKTNAEIAAILRLKTGTIGKYLERIFPKLGVENRTAAASFVLGTNDAN